MKKHKFASLALFLTSIILSVFIAESALRILKPTQIYSGNLPCLYIKDEQFGYRYKPDVTGRYYRNFSFDITVEINSIGFHDSDHDVNIEDIGLRVVAIGNSFTAALEVETSKTWTQILQRELRATGHPTIEVVNLGLDGTGTDVHLDILKQYLPVFKPDLVILAFYENDIDDVSKGHRFRECYEEYVLVFQDEEQRTKLRAIVDAHKPSAFSEWLFNNFYLFRLATYLDREGVLLRSNTLALSRFGITVDKEAVYPAYIDYVFQQFNALSKQHNFKFIVIPVITKDNPTGSLDTLRHNVSELTLAQLNIVDVSPIVHNLLIEDSKPYNELFWRYDGHFNTYGNYIFGLAVSEVINTSFKPHR